MPDTPQRSPQLRVAFCALAASSAGSPVPPGGDRERQSRQGDAGVGRRCPRRRPRRRLRARARAVVRGARDLPRPRDTALPRGVPERPAGEHVRVHGRRSGQTIEVRRLAVLAAPPRQLAKATATAKTVNAAVILLNFRNDKSEPWTTAAARAVGFTKRRLGLGLLRRGDVRADPAHRDRLRLVHHSVRPDELRRRLQRLGRRGQAAAGRLRRGCGAVPEVRLRVAARRLRLVGPGRRRERVPERDDRVPHVRPRDRPHVQPEPRQLDGVHGRRCPHRPIVDVYPERVRRPVRRHGRLAASVDEQPVPLQPDVADLGTGRHLDRDVHPRARGRAARHRAAAAEGHPKRRLVAQPRVPPAARPLRHVLLRDPVANGISIRYLGVAGTTGSKVTGLLDMSPSTSSFGDAPLALGRTFTDPAGGVSITTVALSPFGATVDIVVGAGAAPAPTPTRRP